jgi:YD repeat-containing protein
VEYGWTSNAAAPGVVAGAPFNPYVQYIVETPLGGQSKVTYLQKDSNGNTTSVTEYDWAPASAITRDPATGLVTSACQSGCVALSSKATTYYATTAYWNIGAPRVLGAPQTVTQGNSTATFIYDNALTTANAIQVQRSGSDGLSISTSSTYLSNGNVSSQTDANGNKALICYDSNNLYPVTRVAGTAPGATCPNPVAKPEGRKTTYVFDFASGTQSSETDADNSVTTSMTYDNLGRTTKVQQTATGFSRATSTDYDDANSLVTTTADDTASRTLITKTWLDPLGRVYQSQDATGNKVQKAYRFGTGGQSYELTSNPYLTTNDATIGWTLTKRDVPTPSNLPVKTTMTTYSGIAMPSPWGNNQTSTGTTVSTFVVSPSCTGAGASTTDGAGNTTTRCMDGLGRLKTVSEPDGTTTQYGYDIRGNLTGVDVGSQKRAFEYDSLGRLTKACNPETGTANCSQSPLPANGLEKYTYDANGNALTRTDARGTVTTMSGYDALNRPASKTYTKSDGSPEGTPTVNLGYDQGRRGVLSSVGLSSAAGVFSTSYTYDALGRIKTSTQATAGSTYAFGYTYSLTDQLSQIQYPSGLKVNYVADSVGRISSVQNELTQANYASIDYSAANGVPKMTLGNGMVEQTSWNDRFQLTGLTVGKTGMTPSLALNYYHCAGSAVACASGNNGALRTQRIAGGGLDVTQTYSYL